MRDRTALLEYLKKLIEKIERDAQGLLQAPRLRAYRTLAELHLEFGMLEAAEEDLRRVGEDFFRVEDSGDTHRLAETESFDDPDEVRSLRILFMRILENRFEQGSLDIPALEDLGHLVYSLGHWHLGSRVYHRLIDHYLRQQGAPRHLQRLYHRYFWSHYCRGEAHRGAALEEIHGFVRRHRFDDDLDLTALEEYCALGFHELSLEEDLPGVQANRYRKRADRYYGVIMGRPAAAQRPYLQVLRDGLNRRDDSLSPFDFLKYQYPGVVPYDLPIDRQYFGPIGTDKDVEAEELNIGVGGHGNVHIIKRKVGGVMVPRAIKMLRRDLPDAEFEQVVKDFEQECSIMKDLDHPNIVKFYAAGVDQGRQYIEMEYVRGSDLEVFVHQKGGLIDLAEKLRIFVDVCAGVMYLHCTDRSIVHRDLHPKNVLLGGADAQTVKVADFGLARILDEEGVAKSSRAVGRTFYIPPETTGPSRKPYTIRSDIFSLGRILTFLLTGHPLSDGRALREKVGPALAQVCTDACSSDPEHRPETVAKLLEMLRDATDEDAEVAKRIGDAYTGIERPVSLRELQGRYRPADDQAFPDPSDLASRDFLSIDVADTLDGEEYSLKFISTLRLGGSQIVDRLTRLSQLVAFDHPNIESIVRSGSVKTSSPCFYILYRRIPGLSLMELLGRCFLREQEKGRVLLPVPVAVHVGLETAKALTEAHGQKVVHRMISPSSVSMDLATGRCVLTDFSAAVLKDQENLGRTAVRFGHEDFLAPEAVDAAAGTVSERTDLYSLACTVISTLFGQKRAFVGERDRDLLAERHDLNPEKLHPLLDCLDGARLMRPEDRLYSTAEGFRDALLRASEPLGMDTGSIDWEGIADDFS